MATFQSSGTPPSPGLVWRPRMITLPGGDRYPAQYAERACDSSNKIGSNLRLGSWVGTRRGGILRVMSRIVPSGYTWLVSELDLSHRGDDNNGFNVAAYIIPPNMAQFGNPFGGPADGVPLEANTNIIGAQVGPLEGVLINQATIVSTPTAQGGRILTSMNPRDIVQVPAGFALFGMIIDSAGIGIGTNALRMRAVFAELPQASY